MSDELRDSFDEREPDDPGARFEVREESLGIAWGFVAFLVFAALVTVFIVQNNDRTMVEVLWFDFEMSLGLIITIAVLIAITFDQLISFLYRRRKRRQRRKARDAGTVTPPESS